MQGEARSSAASGYEPLKDAIDDFIKKVKTRYPRRQDGKAFRSRAREIPGYIEQMGLVQTLALCYGKSSNEHQLYMELVLGELKRLGLIKTDDPLEAMRSLVGEEHLATKLLMPYLVQMKKLAEGYYESEEG